MTDPGLPRVDYPRVVHVYHPEINRVQYWQICQEAWATRSTVTGSFDDSGIGQLTSKTAICWGIPEDEKIDFEQWFFTHYPGTGIVFRPAPFWLGNVVDRPFRITWGGVFDNARTYGGRNYFHEGIDLQVINQDGSVANALAGQVGVVERVEYFPAGWGNFVQIRHDWHGDIWRSVYAHLEYSSVAVGQPVEIGQVIGRCGESGNSEGKHLHFTLKNIARGQGPPRYVEDSVVDPTLYFNFGN